MTTLNVQAGVGTTAAEGTFTVPYPSGYSAADFVSGSDATVYALGGAYTCSATFGGGSTITVTWPAGKPSLPAGTYEVSFDLVGGEEIGHTGKYVIAAIADSTAADTAGIVSDFNDLLQALEDAGLMEPRS